MGPSQAKSELSHDSLEYKYSQLYSELHKEEHPLLGSITHVQSKNTGIHYFLKVYKYAAQSEFLHNDRKMKKRKALSDKFEKRKSKNGMLRLAEIMQGKVNEICGVTFYLYCLFEDYDCTLAEEMADRTRERGRKYEQGQIMELLRNMAGGLLLLYDNEFKNYFISRYSLLKVGTTFKILDTTTLRSLHPYQLLYNSMPVPRYTYLAPELLNQLLVKNEEPEITPKADIFSLGMLALEMCLLPNDGLNPYYNYDKCTMNLAQVHNLLKRHTWPYSEYLRELLLSMLEEQEEERIGLLTLKEKVTDSTTTNIDYSAITTQSNFHQAANQPKTDSKDNNPTVARNKSQLNTCVVQNPNGIAMNSQTSKKPDITSNKDNFVVAEPVNGIRRRFSHIGGNNTHNNPNTVYTQPVVEPRRLGNPVTFQAPPPQPPIHNPTSYKLQPPAYSNRTDRCYTLPPTQHHRQQPPPPLQIPAINQRINSNFQPLSLQSLHPIPALSFQSNKPQIKPTSSSSQEQQNTHINPPSTPINSLHMLDSPVVTSLNNIHVGGATGLSFGNNHFAVEFSNNSEQVLTSFNTQIAPKKAPNLKTLQKDKNLFNSPKVTKDEHSSSKKPPSIFSNENTPIRNLQELQTPYNSIDASEFIHEMDGREGLFMKPTVKREESKHDSAKWSPVIRQTEEEHNSCHYTDAKKQDFSHTPLYRIDKPISMKTDQQPHYTEPINNSYGQQQFSNGAVYEGQFDWQGNFHGSGVLYYPNRKVCYSGSWENNAFNGFGVLYNQHPACEMIGRTKDKTNYHNFSVNSAALWHHYQGQFSLDQKHGFGTLYMCNGDKFSGCFVRDAIEGYGTFCESSSGHKISGLWANNLFRM